jgi:hypothetical protein
MTNSLTKLQASDIESLRTVVPDLTEDHFLKLNFRLYGWDKKDAESLLRRFAEAELRLYRNTALKRENVKSWKAGRCYRKGSEDWSRIDGNPLAEEDIDAIKALSYGQDTGTSNVVGDMVAHVTWACDSSD